MPRDSVAEGTAALGPAAARRRPRPARRGLITAAAVLLGLAAACAAALPPPGVLLFGATLEQARGLAVESAASKGWRILSVGTDSAVFEQILEGDEQAGVLTAERLLRIFARFSPDSQGTHVTLRAEEIESPETNDEWRSDVTDRYAENLEKALASLRNRWDAQRPDFAGAHRASRTEGIGSLELGSGQQPPLKVGTWAYAAERYAESRGCQLTDQATRLDASGQGWEDHRVFCQDGSQVLVQCRYGNCTAR